MFKVAKLHPDALIPHRADTGSAGYDLTTVETLTIPPGEQALVPTGLAIEIPYDSYARIAPRSGLAVKHKLHVMAGVIDSSYRGEVRVVLANMSHSPVTFHKGDRIAQLILEKIYLIEPREVLPGELGQTDRGEGGFGSTGLNS